MVFTYNVCCHLFTFSSNYLYVASNSKCLKETQQDWQIICTCALSQFEGICNKILSGHITIDELDVLQPREKQMIKLCTVVTGTVGVKKGHSPFPSPEVLKKNMNARLKESEYFTGFKSQLHHFITYLKTVSVKGNIQM